MSAEMLIANELRVAREDLDGALALAKLGNRNAAYLCEQAAEKILIAVLTSEAKHGGVRHQLTAMVDQLPEENPLKPALRKVEVLGVYATTFRYPTASGRIIPAPATSDLESLLGQVEALLNQAATRFGVDLRKPNSPATNPGPIR